MCTVARKLHCGPKALLVFRKEGQVYGRGSEQIQLRDPYFAKAEEKEDFSPSTPLLHRRLPMRTCRSRPPPRQQRHLHPENHFISISTPSQQCSGQIGFRVIYSQRRKRVYHLSRHNL
ncbi:hypothetical protein CEXT_204441 [Caerostris extrusa]|uniref:Uncharacterized protein n=1 Tax=Caerostris extrusa TaxID=172846 RepID=A0AAV4T0Q7_CAEEX|nr:hypothetical protein CEXT_204441 [Caerostris extrusa]